MHAEPAQVVGHLSDSDAVGVHAAEFGGELSEVAVAESVGLEFEHRERCEQGVGSLLTQAQPGDPRPIGGDDGVGDGVQCISASMPLIGSWLIVWTRSRRLLAVKPISRSAGRFVSPFRTPKSRVLLMVVSVRSAFPSLWYCLIVVFL